MTEDKIDTSDIPEAGPEWFERARLREPKLATNYKIMRDALVRIAESSKRPGPPDLMYWLNVANDRRDIAKDALKLTETALAKLDQKLQIKLEL